MQLDVRTVEPFARQGGRLLNRLLLRGRREETERSIDLEEVTSETGVK